jgi:hypothetical protein
MLNIAASHEISSGSMCLDLAIFEIEERFKLKLQKYPIKINDKKKKIKEGQI